jgi:hypothetical protein
MVPDCIDPKVGSFLRDLMKKSALESVGDCANEYDFGHLWEARLHWSGCPACRPEFAGVPAFFRELGVGLEKRWGDALSDCRDCCLREKNAILAATDDLTKAYAEIMALWAIAEEDVFAFYLHGQEVMSLRPSTESRDGEPRASYGVGEPTLEACREFVSSLGPDLRSFIYAVVRCNDLLMSVREEMASEHAESGHWCGGEEVQQRMQTTIMNSKLQPDLLFSTIEMASIAYSLSLGDWPKDGLSTEVQTDLPLRTLTAQETMALQGVRQEWKRDFDNVGDSLDSLKAGQMEIVRLFEQHRRPATEYEPYIAAQLGGPLYSRLHQMTQRALQVVEHLYNVNQEPDGFALTAVRMAQGYENELNVRIIGPIVIELLAAGAQTYDAQGKSKEPLIRWGKIHKRGMTLGSWAWYLGRDTTMRSKVSERGFDAEAISKDAGWVSEVRNKAAHDFACDRTLADELRRRILCRDGILSRLHPMVATAADALTA